VEEHGFSRAISDATNAPLGAGGKPGIYEYSRGFKLAGCIRTWRDRTVKILAVVFVAALLGMQNADRGPEKKLGSPYRAESSAHIIEGKDAWTFVTENRSFRFKELLGDNGTYEALLLLEEAYHNERTDGIEGMRGNVTISAWALKPGRDRELRWTLQAKGNEGDVQDRLFRVTEWGCCDLPVVYRYFSMLDGKKLYVSNSDLLRVWYGGGPLNERLIGFGYAVMDKESRYPQLQYGTDKAVLQRFSVVSSAEYYNAPQIFVSLGSKLENSLLLESPTAFTIVLKYPDGIELRIPVESDAIRPEKAALPKGYSLRLEN